MTPDFNTTPARTLAKWVLENRGYSLDPKTIHSRRGHGKRGEQVIAPAGKGPKARADEARMFGQRRSLYLTQWGRPEGIDGLLEECQ